MHTLYARKKFNLFLFLFFYLCLLQIFKIFEKFEITSDKSQMLKTQKGARVLRLFFDMWVNSIKWYVHAFFSFACLCFYAFYTFLFWDSLLGIILGTNIACIYDMLHLRYVVSTICCIYDMLYLRYVASTICCIYDMLYLRYVVSTICYIYDTLHLRYVVSTIRCIYDMLYVSNLDKMSLPK